MFSPDNRFIAMIVILALAAVLAWQTYQTKEAFDPTAAVSAMEWAARQSGAARVPLVSGPNGVPQYPF